MYVKLLRSFGRVMWIDRAEKGLAAAVPYAVISTSVEDHGFFCGYFSLHFSCWLYD